jgi:hypothetical protein
MKTANLSEPRGSPKKSTKSIQIKCGFCGFRFGLIWIAVLLLVWFDYDHLYQTGPKSYLKVIIIVVRKPLLQQTS